MTAAPRKFRRRRSDELTVEQTHDPAIIAPMLEKAGIVVPGAGVSAECFLVAYQGDNPVGIACLVTEVDAALMGAVFVVENVRRRGVGTRLVSAVRLAAHTRGARTLYAAVTRASVEYLARFGFVETTCAALSSAFGKSRISEWMRLDEFVGCKALRLDLSTDGLIER